MNHGVDPQDIPASDDFDNANVEYNVIQRPQTVIGEPRAHVSAVRLVRPSSAPYIVFSEENRREIQETLRQEEAGSVPFSPVKRVSSIPSFVEREKLVARFYGYFLQPRSWERDSPLGAPTIEDNIVRNLTVLFYIEDGSVEMSERKMSNSGMSGGAFSKRRQMKKADGTPLKLMDLLPGNAVRVLGQTIHITDADSFTRDYLR